MAIPSVSESDEEFHSLSGHEPDDNEDDDTESAGLEQPPVHPVPCFQKPFEESIRDSIEDSTPRSPLDGDADTRRQRLLDANRYDDSWASRWKQRTTARYHPLLKLMAQIVFGMHLLQEQAAKSEEEVVKILQTHVNEIDSFLERTSEDFDLAIKDIGERIRFLKLPMTHLDVFETMLEDPKFRTQLIEGNDKIEKIIRRTTKAMNGAMLDIEQSRSATKELGLYLDRVQSRWPRDRRAIGDVLAAMRGNEHGWRKYLKQLQGKGRVLQENVSRLEAVVGEMSKLTASAGKKNQMQNRPATSSSNSGSKSAPTSPALRSKFSEDPSPPSSSHKRVVSQSLNKPLPREPRTANAAPQPTTPKPHPVPFAQRFEQPRASPPSPDVKLQRAATSSNRTPPRPKTAGESRDARTPKSQPKPNELAEFLHHSNPLRSNPPDLSLSAVGKAYAEKKSSRSQSLGTVGVLDSINSTASEANKIANESNFQRSRSQRPTNALDMDQYRDSTKVKAKPPPLDLVGKEDDKLTAIPEPRPEPKKKISGSSSRKSTHSTAFARRLSKRMKHLPHDEEPYITASSVRLNRSATSSQHMQRQRQLPHSPPRDSAHSSPPSTSKQLPQQQSQQSPSYVLKAAALTEKISPAHSSRGGGNLGSVRLPRQGDGEGEGVKPDLLSPLSSDTKITALRPREHISPSVYSLASTTTSRRYSSLRKIFRKRADKGRREDAVA